MENPNLYDLLEQTFLRNWRKQLENQEEFHFFDDEQEVIQKLKQECRAEGQPLTTALRVAVETRMDDFYSLLNRKLLYFGVKLGLELQQAFREFDDCE